MFKKVLFTVIFLSLISTSVLAAQRVKFAWNYSTKAQKNVTDFRLIQDGNKSPVMVGIKPSARTLTYNLADTSTSHTFSLIACNSNTKLCSKHSNVVTIPVIVPPAAPTNFHTILIGQEVISGQRRR